nr:hypothetical protein Q903MT_gene2999 [Picea sitchensis]
MIPFTILNQVSYTTCPPPVQENIQPPTSCRTCYEVMPCMRQLEERILIVF